jgi:hypothetical protein
MRNIELEKLALKHYPVNTTWSMGESYDSNEHKRNAFMEGFLVGVSLARQTEKIKISMHEPTNEAQSEACINTDVGGSADKFNIEKAATVISVANQMFGGKKD